MSFLRIQKALVAAVLSFFLICFVGTGFFVVFASEQSAEERKEAELQNIEAEWQKYQEHVEIKYSDRIERNQQRLLLLKQDLEQELQRFSGNREEVAEQERAIEILRSRITTLQGQLENIAIQLRNSEKKINSIAEQIAIKESRLEKVLEEKEHISVEAELQLEIVLSYFRLLQVESESLSSSGLTNIRLLFSPDSFSKNIRDEMHFTALEKTARQLFHDFEGAKAQLEEIDFVLSEERTELKALQENLKQEQKMLLSQQQSQEELYKLTSGEEQRFQELLALSRSQMEQSSEEIREIKADMDYIQEQLQGLELKKTEEKEKLSQDDIRILLETNEALDPEDLFVIEEETDKPFIWPVLPRKITSYFQDKNYEESFGVAHNAIDIRAAQGTEIIAPAAAYVYKAVDNGYGYSYVMLIHKENLMTVFGHVSEIFVKEGDLVQQGDRIALSGGTLGTKGAGVMTTGPHLHFEVWDNGTAVDPLKYLPLSELQPEDVPVEYL